eukprot:GDKH01000521.1.p2 GENE.GDKH01000521.1~~GDKH01000521.1.p2  ORF type:complete len:102 (+),score=4.78 GDKH01000521.1:307-612(+)
MRLSKYMDSVLWVLLCWSHMGTMYHEPAERRSSERTWAPTRALEPHPMTAHVRRVDPVSSCQVAIQDGPVLDLELQYGALPVPFTFLTRKRSFMFIILKSF